MRRGNPLALVVLATGLLGCDGTAMEAIDESSQEIAGGTLTGIEPAAAYYSITVSGVTGWCSGQLVGGAALDILTAKHCTVNGAANIAPAAFKVGFGATPLTSATYTVVAVTQNPAADMALLRLSSPVPGITPMKMTTTVPPPGTSIDYVAYGSTAGGLADQGQKRVTTAKVVASDAATAETVLIANNPTLNVPAGLVTSLENGYGPSLYTQYAAGTTGSHCPYDSGGAAMLTNNRLLVGVINSTVGANDPALGRPNCTDPRALAASGLVGAQQAWITANLAGGGALAFEDGEAYGEDGSVLGGCSASGRDAALLPLLLALLILRIGLRRRLY